MASFQLARLPRLTVDSHCWGASRVDDTQWHRIDRLFAGARFLRQGSEGSLFSVRDASGATLARISGRTFETPHRPTLIETPKGSYKLARGWKFRDVIIGKDTISRSTFLGSRPEICLDDGSRLRYSINRFGLARTMEVTDRAQASVLLTLRWGAPAPRPSGRKGRRDSSQRFAEVDAVALADIFVSDPGLLLAFAFSVFEWECSQYTVSG